MKHVALGFVTFCGLLALGVSGYYLLQDWASLNRSFARWEQLYTNGGSERALRVAETYQNAFRINCFADGVGVLLGAVLAALGILGLCLLPGRNELKNGS